MSIFLSPDSEERPFLRFEAENISNYTALLLSKDGETLYVGAREALFALNSSVSFLPDGGYQEVRDDARGWLGWAEDGRGEDGQEDWSSGSEDAADRRGERRGPACPPSYLLTDLPLLLPSSCGAQMQTGNSSAASRARTHR